LPRQHTQPAERSSAAASTVAALVIRQRRIEVERLVVARPGVEAVPTPVRGMPIALIVVPEDGAHQAIRFTPKWGCSGKSRPEGRMTSIHGAPARLRA
jgi:hypothetical protein